MAQENAFSMQGYHSPFPTPEYAYDRRRRSAQKKSRSGCPTASAIREMDSVDEESSLGIGAFTTLGVFLFLAFLLGLLQSSLTLLFLLKSAL
jgi:hypothetical protein